MLPPATVVASHPRLIASVPPTPTSARLISRSCPNAPIIPWARKPVRWLTKNAGSLRFVSMYLRLIMESDDTRTEGFSVQQTQSIDAHMLEDMRPFSEDKRKHEQA